MKRYQTIIVGGGFYGLRIAQFLCEELGQTKILIIEKEDDVMQRASYNNQARVHNGYHYPRSVLTALRSRVNLPIFSKEFEGAIVNDFDKYYGVATHLSKVTAKQFERFFQMIEADIEKAPEVRHLFDRKFIEEIFKVKECAFNTQEIKKQLLHKLSELGVEVLTKEDAKKLRTIGGKIELSTNKHTFVTDFLINTTYSAINTINKESGLPLIPLKHELTEMCLVRLPQELRQKAFTIMCGPFFSLMPFPSEKDLYTLSHVRYTPHSEWHDDIEFLGHINPKAITKAYKTNYPKMIADVTRYMPIAKKVEYSGKSLWELKTVLPQSERDDSRPILYKEHQGGVRNYICIMGGKIDNVYDVFRELKVTYEGY